MCSAIEYQGKRIYFKDSPKLPILRRDGGVEWVQWGLPYTSDKGHGIPQGACARRESLLAGKWKRLKPAPVKILASAFMERDAAKNEAWFDLPDDHVIQGAMILLDNAIFTRINGEKTAVVYVVTIPASDEVKEVHDRMPRLIQIK